MPVKRTPLGYDPFRKETPPNIVTTRTFKVQGCLPVLVIGVGALVCLYGTTVTSDTVNIIGGALVLVGIGWAVLAGKMTIRFKGKE